MVSGKDVALGLGGFALGFAGGYFLPTLLGAPPSSGSGSGSGGNSSFAVLLINTGASPGLVAPSYQFQSGATVQATVFAASNNPSVQPASVTGYYAQSPGGPFSPGQTFQWNATQTGNAFTFNYGQINQQSTVYVYAVVQFTDGSTARSNTVLIQVA
jgi:hypothetical protein